jgi:hypothetical protein
MDQPPQLPTPGEPKIPQPRRPLLWLFVAWTALCLVLAIRLGISIANQPAPDPRCFEYCDFDAEIARVLLVLLAVVWLIGCALGAISLAILHRPRR